MTPHQPLKLSKLTDQELVEKCYGYTLIDGVFWKLDYEARPWYSIDRKAVEDSLNE